MLGIRVFLVLCWVIVDVNGRWIPNSELDDSWSLFQRVYKKEYVSFEEETNRFVRNSDEIE